MVQQEAGSETRERRVLVVDGDDEDRERLVSHLEHVGLTVDQARSAEEMFARIARRRPEVVVIDLVDDDGTHAAAGTLALSVLEPAPAPAGLVGTNPLGPVPA